MSRKKTWREHTAPYLRKALRQAAKSWKPRVSKASLLKIKQMQKKRDALNAQIRKERDR